ncbi:MAG TPA: alanine--glyoxylate aminotransferase family protein [Nitrososphaerales archaeon]|nr:alanine--glyoxylate aminotransferase family protein [Nitrososphaerales archaeon]
MSAPQKLIMLPGPTNVSERVMKAMTQPIINHRGDGFRTLHKGILEKTKRLFQTVQDVVVLSSSGTGGVEAAVWNLIRPGDLAIVPVFGEFSSRLAETVDLAGGSAVRVEAPLGSTPTIEQLRKSIEENPKFKALYLVHNETSTGVTVQFVKEACRLAKEHGAFAVVDAISSLGGYSIPVDDWGVDICVTGSQKCIAAPPGLALLSVSKAVVDYLKGSPAKTRYFDLERHIEYAAKGETPFTPSLPVFYALDEALKEVFEEGFANRVSRHERMSESLYSGVESMGLKPTAAKEVRSKTVVAVSYPHGVDDSTFRKTLDKEHGIVVGGGFGPFSGKVFRIGCMGLINESYVQRTLDAVSVTLEKIMAP